MLDRIGADIAQQVAGMGEECALRGEVRGEHHQQDGKKLQSGQAERQNDPQRIAHQQPPRCGHRAPCAGGTDLRSAGIHYSGHVSRLERPPRRSGAFGPGETMRAIQLAGAGAVPGSENHSKSTGPQAPVAAARNRQNCLGNHANLTFCGNVEYVNARGSTVCVTQASGSLHVTGRPVFAGKSLCRSQLSVHQSLWYAAGAVRR